MSDTWGKNFKISIFGESHSSSIGIVIDGIPAGFEIDLEKIDVELNRRKPGSNNLSTQRKESDNYKILCGFFNGRATGTSLCAVFENSDTRSHNYDVLSHTFRPSHADFTAYAKYNGYNDYRGGGHFSGRLTASLTFAGAVARQILEGEGIKIYSHVLSIKDANDICFEELQSQYVLSRLSMETIPTLNPDAAKKMQDEILLAKKDGNSVGGVIECMVNNVPIGLGEPFFDSVESKLASLLFSIPAVKGVSFGKGFDISSMLGTDANDPLSFENGKITTKTNNAGGINGGITNGMPIILKVAFRPTPSVFKQQSTINVNTGENTTLSLEGRHDPCVILRAVPVVEAASAIGLLDLLMDEKKLRF